MFVILSGAFVGQELESEFGRIPPSFLPLGNRRLFQHQIKLAPKGVDVYLSVPESFSVPQLDKEWLTNNQVKLVSTPDGLSLGASLVAVMNISEHTLDTPVHVLYGDTLFKQIPAGDDIVSVSVAKDNYNWAVLTDDKTDWLKDYQSTDVEEHRIIDGYFKFSNPRELLRCITQAKWDFIGGLNNYQKAIGLTPVNSLGWLDFGHVNTYYKSKAKYTTQRSFNELLITNDWVEKTSDKEDKIAAEANWFETIPYELRGHIPQYLGSRVKEGKTSYKLEFLHLTALNELFVFSKISSNLWKKILNNCIEFIVNCSEQEVQVNDRVNTLDLLFKTKTRNRLEEYFNAKKISLNTVWEFEGEQISVSEILNFSEKHLPSSDSNIGVLHGDFCFSNILYDFRASKVKTIDPRGLDPKGNKTIYGDIRYDIAKLSHSVLGLYDWIIAGYYKVSIENKEINFCIADGGVHREIQQDFIKNVELQFGLSAQNLYSMQIQLFLSMLPLHADDARRQDALFANVFRLYQILQRIGK